MSALRRTVHLELSGLLAVHAVRAVHTALGGVPGVHTAQVSMTGAELEMSGPYDAATLSRDVRIALEPIGIQLTSITERQDRRLPLLGDLTRD